MKPSRNPSEPPKRAPGRILAELTGAAALAAFLAAGCGPTGEPSAASPGVVVPVRVVTVGVGEGPGSVLGGTLRARDRATLRAGSSGRVTFLATDGARFRSGDPLVLFAATEARRALASADVRAAATEARRVESARQSARLDTLHARGIVAVRDRDLARLDAALADAEAASAVADRERLRANFALRAPFDGVVARRLVEPGADVVGGQPLLEIDSDAGEEIAVALPETRADRLAGIKVRFADDGPWLDARPIRREAAVDPASRTRVVYLVAPVRSGLPSGSFVRVRVRDEGESRLLVPEAAIVRRGGLVGVFVVDASRAWLRWVRAGEGAGDSVEVLAGLERGERIAADAAGLADGKSIRSLP